MKTVLFFLSFWAFSSSNANNNSITPEEVAGRYCSCAQENKLPAFAKSYMETKDVELKEKAKADYVIALRNTQQCIKMDEVQLAVRQLPREQRSQFEKNIMKVLTETCSDVAASLQVLK